MLLTISNEESRAAMLSKYIELIQNDMRLHVSMCKSQCDVPLVGVLLPSACLWLSQCTENDGEYMQRDVS
jgi:hypothetical protein